MKKFLLPLLALASSVFAETSSEPPARIDVSAFPKTSKMIDDVVVPVPSEVFAVLDKLGRPSWPAVLRSSKSAVKLPGEQAHTALLLGTVIAEGFIAVEAQDTAEVKAIGRNVLKLAMALGVGKEVTKRTNSIVALANSSDWPGVRKELDGALADVKAAMIKLNSEPLSQLVSLGGWLRGTEALTAVVNTKYTKDGAEFAHQPVLLDYFDQTDLEHETKVQVRPGGDEGAEGTRRYSATDWTRGRRGDFRQDGARDQCDRRGPRPDDQREGKRKQLMTAASCSL
jgi:hypothetical protein